MTPTILISIIVILGLTIGYTKAKRDNDLLTFESDLDNNEIETKAEYNVNTIARTEYPYKFEQYIGHKNVLYELNMIISNYQKLGQKIDHILFEGNGGLGKTNLTEIIANTVGCGYFPVIGESLKNTKIVDNLLMKIPEGGIFFIDECVTPDTEILTEKGFQRFDQLDKDIKVAQFNHGFIDFVRPTKYIEKDYKGNLIRLHTDKSCDITMTPNHQVLYRYNNRDIKEAVVKANLRNQKKKMYVAGLASTISNKVLTQTERLAIALQADGNINYLGTYGTTIDFGLKKKKKIKRLLDILSTGEFNYTELSDKREEYRRFIVKVDHSFNKSIQSFFELSEIGYEKAQAIIEEMSYWDSSKFNKAGIYFSSVDEDAVNFYQAVAVLAGYKATKTVQVDNRKVTYQDVHRLFISTDKHQISCQGMKKKEIPYNGKVYCVRVPSGNIVLRSNGRVLVTGNCHNMKLEVMEYLYHPMEKGKIFRKDGTIYDLPNITIVGATTNAENLPDPLLQRFAYKFHLERYSNNEIVEILKHCLPDNIESITDEAMELIAIMSQGTIRKAREEWLKACVNLALYNGITEIGRDIVMEVIKLRSCDAVTGLDKLQIRVLSVLFDSPNALGIRNLATRLEIDAKKLEMKVEPYLIVKNFIEKTTKGRVLTNHGAEHIRRINKEK